MARAGLATRMAMLHDRRDPDRCRAGSQAEPVQGVGKAAEHDGNAALVHGLPHAQWAARPAAAATPMR